MNERFNKNSLAAKAKKEFKEPKTSKCPNCDELQAIFDMQHKRTTKADKAWQKSHNKPGILPDLGTLIEWLMKEAKLK